MSLRFAIITCSSTRSLENDTAGKALCELVEAPGWEVASHCVVKDDIAEISQAIVYATDELFCDIVITCGGTGLSDHDVTPEATLRVCDREIPGIAEACRAYSMRCTPRAMLSRGVCAQRKRSIVVNFPGSERAARQNWEAIYEQFEHGVQMMAGGGHS